MSEKQIIEKFENAIAAMERLVASGEDDSQAYAQIGKPVGAWFTDTYGLEHSTTPRGGKTLKEEAQRIVWSIRNRVSMTKDRAAGLQALKGEWDRFKPMVKDFARVFGGKEEVPSSQKTTYALYVNKRGLSAKDFAKYVRSLDGLLGGLRGWRKKALSGTLQVIFAGPGDFRGTSSGRYSVKEDALYVRATPAVLKRDGGYASASYILIHELGHRYEQKNGTPVDFDRSPWHTTRYSRSSSGSLSEAFAELFALGHFGIRSEGGDFGDVLDRFESLMSGKGKTARRPIPVDKQQISRLTKSMMDLLEKKLEEKVHPRFDGDPVGWIPSFSKWKAQAGILETTSVDGNRINVPVYVEFREGNTSSAESRQWVAGGAVQSVAFKARGRSQPVHVIVSIDSKHTAEEISKNLLRVHKEVYSVLMHEATHVRDILTHSDLPESSEEYVNRPTEVRAFMQQIVLEIEPQFMIAFRDAKRDLKDDPEWVAGTIWALKGSDSIQRFLDKAPTWIRMLKSGMSTKNLREIRKAVAAHVTMLWDKHAAPLVGDRPPSLKYLLKAAGVRRLTLARQITHMAMQVPVRDERAYVKATLRTLSRYAAKASEFSDALIGSHDILLPYLEYFSGSPNVWHWWDSSKEVSDVIKLIKEYVPDTYGLGQLSRYLDPVGDRNKKQRQMLDLATALVNGDFIRKLKADGVYPKDARWPDESVGDVDLRPLLKSAEAFARFYEEVHSFQMRARSVPSLEETMQIQDVETLYHVSLKAKQLASKGFSSTMPKEDSGYGLGGSQQARGGQKGISFTYDRNHARQMYRLLRELHDAVTGKIKAGFVIDAVQRSRNPKAVWDAYGKGPEGLKNSLEVAYLYYQYTLIGEDRPKIMVMNVWRFLQILSSVSRQDIGIVVADVDMKHPGVVTLSGEREVRVPPSAVLEVKRLIQ